MTDRAMSGGAPASSRVTPRELLLIFVFWTSLAALSTVNRVFDPRADALRFITPASSMVFPFIEAWLWAGLTPLIFTLSSRFRVERTNWYAHVPVLILAGVAIAIAADVVLDFIRFEFFPRPRRRAFAPLPAIGRFLFLNELVVYLAVLAAGFAREYFRRDQESAREAAESNARAAQLEAQLAHARLDALRMQMNPHFLFNTLHAVSALVERDPSGVRRMLARLSDLLRRTLDARGADEVSLREELAFLRGYLDIMEVRFAGRLQVKTAVPPDLLDALVPSFILQPVVENALEHGVARIEGEGRVSIEAARDGDDLVLTVRDNGPGLQDVERSGGIGVKNTRARLSELYGDEARLELKPEDGGVAAEVRLPYHTVADLRSEVAGE